MKSQFENVSRQISGTIDLVFSNKEQATCGILDSLTKTDHHPIFTSIPRNRISKEDKSTKR